MSDVQESPPGGPEKVPLPPGVTVKIVNGEEVFSGKCPDGHDVCDGCGECHECEDLAAEAERKAKEPVTQKAKGVKVLQRAGWPAPAVSVIKKEDQIKNAFTTTRVALGLTSTQKAVLFARPCPIRPRHGFVESRRVSSIEEVGIVFKEAQQADAEAELMLMPMIEATHNMLWRPGLVAIGPNHDGATAGYKSIGVPLLKLDFLDYMSQLNKDAGVGADEDPYIEAVISSKDENTFFTQLRAGARVEGLGPDYIPHAMLVKRIVDAEGDLLEWEAIAETLKGEEGVVVWHPGGTLASHFSVHSIQRGIAIVTSVKPIVGETLVQKTLPPPDIASVVDGIAAGTAMPMMKSKSSGRSYERLVCTVLTGLHHSAAMGGDNGFYIGVAAAMMIRLGYAAAIGESRHNSGSVIFTEQAGPNKEFKFGGLGRSQIYEKALTGSIFDHRHLIGPVYQLFMKKGLWGGSYGGPKWGSCTKATIELDAACIGLTATPSRDAVIRVVSALNNAVNQAHNNGWWLNKFADASLFDRAPKGDPRSIIPAGIAFFDSRNVDPARLVEARAAWAAATPISTIVPDGVEASTTVIMPKGASVGAKLKAAEALALAKAAAKAASKPKTPPTLVPIVVTGVQGVWRGDNKIHLQYKMTGTVAISDGEAVDGSTQGYSTVDLVVPPNVLEALKGADTTAQKAMNAQEQVSSWAGSGTAYQKVLFKQLPNGTLNFYLHKVDPAFMMKSVKLPKVTL